MTQTRMNVQVKRLSCLVRSGANLPRREKRNSAGRTKAGVGKRCAMTRMSAGESRRADLASSVRSAYIIRCSHAFVSELTVHCRCRWSHDVPAYLAAKPRDVRFPTPSDLSDIPPFVQTVGDAGAMQTGDEKEESSIDFSTKCPVFEETGACRHGFKCRFLGGHVRKAEDNTLLLVQDEDRKARLMRSTTEANFLDASTMKLLRTKKV